MNFLKSPWFLAIAALITIIGIVTGKFLFIFLILPLGLFKFGNKDK